MIYEGPVTFSQKTFGQLTKHQGSHNKWQQTFFIQKSNREKVGKFSFANRLNDIVSLLSDAWLNESEKQMKKTLKTLILETVTAKCDI
jgi:hypothetical protein